MSRPTHTDDWDRHWGDYAESAEANPAQRYRTRLIFALIGLTNGPNRLVDIGSGQGDFVAQVRKRWPLTEAIGIELSEAGCKIARRKVPDARFLQRDLVEAGGAPANLRNWATHAVCSEVLEHVDRPDKLVRHTRAYLAPGCRVVVTVPGGPMSAFDRHIGHRRHYTKKTLHALLDEAGLEVERIAAAGFPFHNLYRLAVVVRGRTLISEVTGPSSRLMRWTSLLFDVAFHLNLRTSPWGWQLVAIARVPS